jgi:hypothetical protein
MGSKMPWWNAQVGQGKSQRRLSRARAAASSSARRAASSRHALFTLQLNSTRTFATAWWRHEDPPSVCLASIGLLSGPQRRWHINGSNPAKTWRPAMLPNLPLRGEDSMTLALRPPTLRLSLSRTHSRMVIPAREVTREWHTLRTRAGWGGSSSRAGDCGAGSGPGLLGAPARRVPGSLTMAGPVQWRPGPPKGPHNNSVNGVSPEPVRTPTASRPEVRAKP